jgi:hypothetical protein
MLAFLQRVVAKLKALHLLAKEYRSRPHHLKDKLQRIANHLKNPSIVIGQIVLFVGMLDPEVPCIQVLQPAAHDDDSSTNFVIQRLEYLPARLKHWTNHPLMWWCLHECGNGHGKKSKTGTPKFGCKSYKHAAAGPHIVNAAHIEKHFIMETAVNLEALPTDKAGRNVVLLMLRAKVELQLPLTLYK